MPPGEVKDSQSNDGNGQKTGYLYRYDKMSANGRSVIPVLNAQDLSRGQFVVFNVVPMKLENSDVKIPIAVIPDGFFKKPYWDEGIQEQWDSDWNNAIDMTVGDIEKRNNSRKPPLKNE